MRKNSEFPARIRDPRLQASEAPAMPPEVFVVAFERQVAGVRWDSIVTDATVLEAVAVAFRVAQAEVVNVLVSDFHWHLEDARCMALEFAEEAGNWLLTSSERGFYDPAELPLYAERAWARRRSKSSHPQRRMQR